MRTTLAIDDDLLRQLKEQAVKSRVPLRRLVNTTLRNGIAAQQPALRKTTYTCPSFSMGKPSIGLDKALTLTVNP
jgi:hypothetical protein